VTSHTVARWTRRGSAALAIVLAAACASAEKRMNQGLVLEQRGRPADAAERYIDALEKDPSLATARARLQETGDRAVQEAISESASLAAAGRGAEAADALLRLDALRRDASAVGVRLATPADYEQRRRATFDRAIGDAIAYAERAGGSGSFGEAVSRLERAADRWDPGPGQRAELDRARFEAQVGWAEAGMRAGQYRAAHERARAAAALFGRESPEARRALALQDEALRRGTLRVAILPVGSEPGARAKLPDDLVPALNDALELNHWPRAPLFVQVLDPRTVRGAARRHGYARQAASLRDAVELGRAVGAELVVRPAIDSVVVTESGVRETRRPVRTAAGADTAYTVREGRRAMRVRVTYTVVRVGDYRESPEERVWASGDTDFREAVYRGDPRELTLASRERDLFDERRAGRAGRDLIAELTRELGPRLEREVFDRLLRDVR
jgi:tetratricopeptide (TPR) repeat protein